MSKFTKEYFIEKFEAIPEENWITGKLVHPTKPGCHCALGHCGVREDNFGSWVETQESKALNKILGREAWYINDALSDRKNHTPKARILSALKDVK